MLVHNCLAYRHKKNLLRNQRTKNRLNAKGPFTWLSLTLKKWQNERHDVLTPLAGFIEESRISNILKANLLSSSISREVIKWVYKNLDPCKRLHGTSLWKRQQSLLPHVHVIVGVARRWSYGPNIGLVCTALMSS